MKEGEEDEDHHDDEKTIQNPTITITNATSDSDSREPPLLGRGELLQIKIIYGDDCIVCSRVRTVVARNETITNATETTGYLRSRYLSQSKLTLWSDDGERSLAEPLLGASILGYKCVQILYQ